MTPPRRLVIVGNGMAGARLAENVIARAGEQRFEVVIFGEEAGGNYNRILLSGVLAGTHAGPDIVLNPVEWYAAQGIALHSGVSIAALDLPRRQVVDARGAAHRYDILVLATGSRPVVPPIPGLTMADRSLATGAFVFRSVDDCARIAAAAAQAHRAIVLGGGLLGLEAARALLAHGADVTVVHLAGHVMEAQLDAPGGRILRTRLEAMGVRILTGKSTTRVTGGDKVEAVEFSDGSRQRCDLLVVAAGVRSDTSLAQSGGLRTNRGVIVGDDLACIGAPDVYAIGDCAEHRGTVYGLVAPAWEQAEVLASRLTGTRPTAVYGGSQVATKLKVAGVDVAVMGEREGSDTDEMVSYAEPSRGIYGKLIIRDDRLAGAIVIGLPGAAASLVQRFVDSAPAPAQRSELLFPPIGDARPRSVDEIPDSARICDCNAVVKEAIVDTVLAGARSLSAVCERTRAGTGCGSCRPEVQRIVDAVCRDIADTPTRTTSAAAGAVSGKGEPGRAIS